MIRSYKYRIYPTKRQESILNEQLAVCCELYNAALQERKQAWEYERKTLTYFDQTVQLVHIKAIREDVAAISIGVLENALKRVHLAYQAFFRRIKNGEKAGYPRFRSAVRYNSLTFRQIGRALNQNKLRLRLSKIGHVKIKLHRVFVGDVKTLSIKRDGGRWFAIFAVEENPTRLPVNNDAIGIDVGITAFATLSDGSEIANPRYYEHAQRKLRIANRKVARRKRGSRRRRKAIQLLQRAHAHVRNQRGDFHHKISRWLVNNYGLIAVEDLNVKGLAGGMLAKSVSDAGWGTFLDKVAYKAECAGRDFFRVTPGGTSQTCVCGARVEKTLRQRWHECSACGLSAARDHVSAQIILARGLRVQALTSPVAERVA